MHRFTAKLQPSLPVIAIDLGYSNRLPSCGFVSSSEKGAKELTFGDCVNETARLIEQQGPHTLIIEAVLSTYHNADGNPEVRGDWEKGRGWYHGPGATTFAAALQFLRQLDLFLPRSIKGIPLIEGFLSYKTTRTKHSDDATRMLTECDSAERFQPVTGTEPIGHLIDGVPEVRKFHPPTTKPD